MSADQDPWAEAVDWLLNQPLDEADRIRFNCIADGLATRQEVNELSDDELAARQEAAEVAARGRGGKEE